VVGVLLLGGVAAPSGAGAALRGAWAVQATPAALLPVMMRGYGPADVRITTLRYDATDEYVELMNAGLAEQVMTGWKIHSVVGDQWFVFPDGYVLAGGARVRVHSGPDAVDDPPGDLLWATAYYWRNEGDEAVVYDELGGVVDRVCYGEGCP